MGQVLVISYWIILDVMELKRIYLTVGTMKLALMTVIILKMLEYFVMKVRKE